ncbi:hypothetical protein OSTOST_15078 [Ostertagia ostertagi]
MSILIFMVSDKMPSTSSFIPLIGILGKPPSRKTMRWARLVARCVRMEMPLLMKQAYAPLKFTLCKYSMNQLALVTINLAEFREDKLRRAQDGRKQSLWQRVYKLAKEQGHIRKQSRSIAKSERNWKHVVTGHSAITSAKEKLHNQHGLPSLGDTSALVEFSNMSDEDNSSFPDIDLAAATPATPVSKFHSLHKMSTCASLDSMIRNVDMSVTSPRTIQRNLAELEYDWLAAVIERIFLIFFIIVFLLTSVGINCIGLYYWYVAQNDPHFGLAES